MANKPLVSIITPAFNASAYIAAAIESVLGQDYPNIEYIVMDGGSTDGTLDIIRRYEGRLCYQSAPDAGTADAVNQGFLRSRGSIFAWLSADDLYTPGAVTRAVDRFLSKPNVGVVYGAACWIDAAGSTLGPYPTGAFDAERLARECFVCQPAAFIRAEAFRQVGMLDVSDQFSFDYDLWIRLSRIAEFEYTGETFAMSRMHGGNKTLGTRRKILQASIRLLERHYQYVPVQWIYGYMHHLIHGGDQFFLPVRNSVPAFAMALLFGSWINRRHPVRYWREWLATGARAIQGGRG